MDIYANCVFAPSLAESASIILHNYKWKTDDKFVRYCRYMIYRDIKCRRLQMYLIILSEIDFSMEFYYDIKNNNIEKYVLASLPLTYKKPTFQFLPCHISFATSFDHTILSYLLKPYSIIYSKNQWYFDIVEHKYNNCKTFFTFLKDKMNEKNDCVIYLSVRNSYNSEYHANYLYWDVKKQYWFRIEPLGFNFRKQSLIIDKYLQKSLKKNYHKSMTFIPGPQRVLSEQWCILFATLLVFEYAKYKNYKTILLNLMNPLVLEQKIRDLYDIFIINKKND